MHNAARRCALVCALFFAALAALAQGGRTRVFGSVKDEAGEPLELASVRRQGTAQLVLTNLQGRYEIFVEQGDTCTLVYGLIGYEQRKRKFTPLGDSLRLDVTLPSLAAMTGEAVVSAQHVQTDAMQRLHAEDTRHMPSTTGNGVEELVATQAGVSTRNELSSQYNVRGGSFDENLVYLNGVEIYRPMLVRSGEQEGLSVINSDMVERIDFSNGGFAARYADKMSSVLDITYKRPEAFEAKLDASLLGASAYVGAGNKHVSFMTGLRYKTTEYLLGSTDTKAEYAPRFLDYQAYLSWRPNARWSLDLLGNINDNHYLFRPKDRETHFGTIDNPRTFRVYFDGQEKDSYRTYLGALTLTHHFNPETYLALTASAFTTREYENYDISGQYWLQEATSQDELGVGTYMEHARNRLQARVVQGGLTFRTRLTGHTLMAGAGLQSERIRERAREWEMRDSMGYSLPYDPQALQLIYSLAAREEISSRRLSAYVQDTWRMYPSAGLINLTYGVRVSHWSWNGETLISPRASVGFIPAANDRWTLRAALGMYYQAPFYKELRDTTLNAGIATVRLNKDIRAQRSVQFIVGGDYAFRMLDRPFRFTAEAYYKSLSRLIPYSVSGVRTVYEGENLSRGYAVGVDFKLFGEFVPGTDSWVTLSVMQTRERIAGQWLPRPTDGRYALSLFLTDYFPGTTRWKLTLKAAVADGLPFGPPHSERAQQRFRAPAYKRVDVGLSYRLYGGEDRLGRSGLARAVKNVWLGVDAFNLLGISNVSSYYWVTDITNTRYAVPNYLTGRLISARVSVEF
ncbi:MAG: TonB-dependent receptor plug domain-containing protein [Bacteroidaceae bacterium]|nr:TonB-dependent receptor plug domain-containing protein [Bacteroidaceae bacterium]